MLAFARSPPPGMVSEGSARGSCRPRRCYAPPTDRGSRRRDVLLVSPAEANVGAFRGRALARTSSTAGAGVAMGWRLFAAVNSPGLRFPLALILGGAHLLIGRSVA